MNHVIAYNSITGLKMWVVEVGVDPAPGDEFGRNIRGSNRLKNAHHFTPEFALESLPRVREVHRDAWIEQANGREIDPAAGHSDAL